jgi:hypothetical protein
VSAFCLQLAVLHRRLLGTGEPGLNANIVAHWRTHTSFNRSGRQWRSVQRDVSETTDFISTSSP